MTSSEKLGRQIEQMVREHLAECQRAVTAAVTRAFATANAEPQRRSRRADAAKTATTRRTPEQVAALGERLYAAMCETPGETITVLAGRLGTTPRALQVPVKHLKRAGRVRTVGQRQSTRYFPMLGTEPEQAETEIEPQPAKQVAA